ESTFSKYGFRQAGQSGDYTLYQNVNALPLAFTAPLSVNDVEQPAKLYPHVVGSFSSTIRIPVSVLLNNFQFLYLLVVTFV
ncbi:hypothetical protein, partial [Enterococcus faecium]|uniref:hypothetical protein n=1 Tax=Enterococcus faecium TaxID=1352 RepID=UPI0029302D8F